MHRYLKRKKVLYITGEESLSQTKLRAERLDEDSSELQVLAETDLEVIYQTVKEEQPDFTSSGFDSNNISS
ncbi:DNA repair protein RadA [Staphylococcus aureus]|nr:DNA repair protein RadA [Staphylococcus aureus]